MAALAAFLLDHEATGVTVFAASGDVERAIHVRSFAPAQGVPENPVCGSGNLAVAAYLQFMHDERFGPRYAARQVMQLGRDGRVSVRIGADGLRIGGRALTRVDGVLQI